MKEVLYTGQEVIVDYNETNNKELIKFFEDASMFEGYARIEFIINDKVSIEGFNGLIDIEHIITIDELNEID